MDVKIKDLPLLSQPRKKALYYGLETLSDEEILTLIISSGTKGNSAKDIAYQILNDNKGLYNTSKLPFNEFLKYKGISEVKALFIAAVFELSRRIKISTLENISEKVDENYLFLKYQEKLSLGKQESLVLIMLNRSYELIHETILAKGSKNHVTFDIEMIFRELLNRNAKYFYLLHNHPSGNLLPSEDDLSLTKTIIDQSKTFKIMLLDHLIIGEKGYFSFKKGQIINNYK